MAYLTSFKSSMPHQHWWPSRRKQWVGVVFTEKSQAGIIHYLAQLYPAWQELCVEKTLTREIFQIFSIWTFEKGCQQCSFYSQPCKLMQKLELYFTSPWRTAGPSSDLMDDLSDQSVKDSCLFSLVQDRVSVDHCRNPSKIFFAGRSPLCWFTPDILPLQHLRVHLGDLYNQLQCHRQIWSLY